MGSTVPGYVAPSVARVVDVPTSHLGRLNSLYNLCDSNQRYFILQGATRSGGEVRCNEQREACLQWLSWPEHEASHLDPATFKPVAVLSMWNYPRPTLRGSGSVYCSMASAIHRLVTFTPDEGPT